jgi:transcriptional regulator with XRE-family HTH domain
VKILRIKYGNYAERLRALGLDQQDVAQAVGVSSRHWSLIVLGKSSNPFAVTAREAAAVLGMEFDDLWEVVEVPDPPVSLANSGPRVRVQTLDDVTPPPAGTPADGRQAREYDPL